MMEVSPCLLVITLNIDGVNSSKHRNRKNRVKKSNSMLPSKDSKIQIYLK